MSTVKTFVPKIVLGFGTYGLVYLGQSLSGDLVAIKAYKEGTGNYRISESSIREIAVHNMISHKNIIKLLDVKILTGVTHAVLEYMPQTLSNFIKQNTTKTDIGQVLHLASQLFNAILYLHTKNVVHRDVKPTNIYIDQERNLKLGDFGSAINLNFTCYRQTNCHGTVPYLAPEAIISPNQSGKAQDLWAAGCVLFELITGKRLIIFDQPEKVYLESYYYFEIANEVADDAYYIRFGQNSSIIINNKIYIQQVLESLNPFVADLLVNLLQLNPENRITAKQAIEHAVFSQV